MANNNTVTLIGNLGKDPASYSRDKGSFVHFSLATTGSYKDKQTGAWMKRKSVWHTVFVSTEKLQETALKYKKGDRIKVTGSLCYRRIKATIKGHSQSFNEASISVYKIEDAALQQKTTQSEGETAA